MFTVPLSGPQHAAAIRPGRPRQLAAVLLLEDAAHLPLRIFVMWPNHPCHYIPVQKQYDSIPAADQGLLDRLR